MNDAHLYTSSFKDRLKEEKKVRVYYLRSVDDNNNPTYAYAIVSSLLHDQFMKALELGQVPDYAVVVETGEGEPTQAIKDKMKEYYNFDHDLYVSNAA